MDINSQVSNQHAISWWWWWCGWKNDPKTSTSCMGQKQDARVCSYGQFQQGLEWWPSCCLSGGCCSSWPFPRMWGFGSRRSTWKCKSCNAGSRGLAWCTTGEEYERGCGQTSLSVTPKSDWHLISPHHITPESNIKVRRIKELITD